MGSGKLGNKTGKSSPMCNSVYMFVINRLSYIRLLLADIQNSLVLTYCTRISAAYFCICVIQGVFARLAREI